MSINITADIIFTYQFNYTSFSGQTLIIGIFNFADPGLQESVNPVLVGGFVGNSENLTTTPYPTFAYSNIIPDMANYYFSSSSASLISELNTFQSDIAYSVGNLLYVDEETQMMLNLKQPLNSNLTSLSGLALVASSILTTDGSANLNQTAINMLSIPYGNLTGAPSIPTALSQLTNDTNFISSSAAAGTYVPKTTTVNSKALSTNIVLVASDVGAPSGSGTSTGTNTGDQIVPSNTSAISHNFFTAYNSGTGAFTQGQPAYSDISGTISTSQIGASQVTYAKIQNESASTLLGNPTASAAAPEEVTIGNGLVFSGTALTALRTTSALSLSLVGAGATGTQISATKDSTVRLNVSTSTTSTIGGPSVSAVALKICSTNNATEASWTTVATLENDQTITLAVALNSVQVIKGQLCSDLPAGYYIKLVNSGSGTHSESFISGQQTIYG